jgi:hypothetical protein
LRQQVKIALPVSLVVKARLPVRPVDGVDREGPLRRGGGFDDVAHVFERPIDVRGPADAIGDIEQRVHEPAVVRCGEEQHRPAVGIDAMDQERFPRLRDAQIVGLEQIGGDRVVRPGGDNHNLPARGLNRIDLFRFRPARLQGGDKLSQTMGNGSRRLRVSDD